MRSRASRSAAPRLVLGATLMALGALLTLDRLRFVTLRPIWRLWPLTLVGLGLSKFLQPQDARPSQGGLWLIIVGAWLLINNFGVLGLSFGTSWPLLLIGFGAALVLQAVFRPHRPDTAEEVRHER